MGETNADADARADEATRRADAADARADASDARADASDDRADHLLIALDSRDVIGMAKGILMHAQNIGPEQAFRMLVTVSQRENRKLHDVASDLVSSYPVGGGDAAGPPSPLDLTDHRSRV